MKRISELQTAVIWDLYAKTPTSASTRRILLSAYSAVSSKHLPRYLNELTYLEDVAFLQQFQFPSMPDGYLKRIGNQKNLDASSKVRQDAKREQLKAIFPHLREVVLARHKCAKRLLRAFHEAQQEVNAGAPFPFSFHYQESVPSITQSPMGLQQRVVSLHFRLWTKRSWVLAHTERYSKKEIGKAIKWSGLYAEAKDQYFVEFTETADQLLWFGDLVAYRLLQNVSQNPHKNDQAYIESLQFARQYGFYYGCATNHAGLLQAPTTWLAFNSQPGELLFDLEACYRGILYGAALATLAMSNGGSLSEILQISANRWITSEEKQSLHLQQKLLPEDSRLRSERRAFFIIPEAKHLLDEIEQALKEQYGEIPIVSPARRISKADQLHKERYLFQWKKGMLSPNDTEVLIRFILHGIHLATPDGQMIRFSMELLRSGGVFSLEARSKLLMQTFGFNEQILPQLAPSSSTQYCCTFFAYWQFAGSREAALRPATFENWLRFLEKELKYKQASVTTQYNKMLQILLAAGAKGFIEPELARAFQRTEGHHRKKRTAIPEAHIAFLQTYRTCGKTKCATCQNGGKHGPYWYVYWRENGKQQRIYVGRNRDDTTIAKIKQKIEEKRQKRDGAVHTLQAEQHEPMTSLTALVCQFILRRKELAGRILAAFQTILQQMAPSEALPFSFVHPDIVPEFIFDPEEPQTSSLRERKVLLPFTLWDKRSWVIAHQDRFKRESILHANRGERAYRTENNTGFVQFQGTPADLWFADLLDLHLLQQFKSTKEDDEASRHRNQFARIHGFPKGVYASRPGLLTSHDRWFAGIACEKEMVFEPEAFYRGILFASTLAVLTLNGQLDQNELLQVSTDRWISQVNSGKPPTSEQWHVQAVKTRFQSLYPRDTQTEKDRRLFEISSEGEILLEELAYELRQNYGEIPLVDPPKLPATGIGAFLRPERYLFQWQARAIAYYDINVLLRFLLHGVQESLGARSISTEKLENLAANAEMLMNQDLLRLRNDLIAPLKEQGLTASSLKFYYHSLTAYLRFANSTEQAFQVETFTDWIAYLSKNDQAYKPDLIRQKVTPVRSCLRVAVQLGYIDQARADTFDQVKIETNKPKRLSQVDQDVFNWIHERWLENRSIAVGDLQTACAKEFGQLINRKAIHAVLQQMKRSEPLQTPGISEADKRWIVEQCENDRDITARELQEMVQDVRGTKISRLTAHISQSHVEIL